MKKKKSNKILVVIGIYILVILIFFILSSVIENGRECFAVNPYWNYGPIILPCYFFDSLFKILLIPSIFLLYLFPKNFSNYQLFFALVLNSIFIYFLIKVIVKLKSKWLGKLYILLIIPIVVVLLAIFWFLKPIFIEEYCTNQAKKIVGDQWGRMYTPTEIERKEAGQNMDQIAWGFREELKCERKFENILKNAPLILTPVLQKPREKIISYTVVNGETIQSIADKFGISIGTIRWANNLSSDKLISGQTLYILPVTGIAYKVLRGDTIDSLAKKYHTTPEKIKDFPFNKFADPKIFTLIPGDTLIIPDGTK